MKECIGQEFLGEWSSMIDYEMCSSSAGVYIMAKTSSMKKFKHEWKNNMTVNTTTLFATRILWRSSSLNNRKPSDKKLSLWRHPIFF